MEKYVNEILEYQDILKLQIERETHDFKGWYTKDFIQYIKYLEKITQITNNLGL